MALFLTALALGGFLALALYLTRRYDARGEKPSRLWPRFWVAGDPEASARRYQDALAAWRQRRRPYW